MTFVTWPNARLHSVFMQVVPTNSLKPARHFFGGQTKRHLVRRRNRTKYTHDKNGRIETIDAASNNAYDRIFTYDGAGRLKTASGPWGAGSYGIDALGNLQSKSLGSRTVTLEYTAANRLNRVKDTAAGSIWRYYSYDGRGNVTDDDIHTFTYDIENQPISVGGPDTGTYQYDGNLKRVKQVVEGVTIYSIYDSSGAMLTRHNANTNTKTDYLAVTGKTLVRVTNGTASYPLNDHLGTAYTVTNANGSVLSGQAFNYTPYGEIYPYGGPGPGVSNQQGFTGHIEDETGLTYMQARFYEPIIGRFLQTDPVGHKDQLNLYAYVHNDPVNAIDRYGKDAWGVSFGFSRTRMDEPKISVQFNIMLDSSGNFAIQQTFETGMGVGHADSVFANGVYSTLDTVHDLEKSGVAVAGSFDKANFSLSAPTPDLTKGVTLEAGITLPLGKGTKAEAGYVATWTKTLASTDILGKIGSVIGNKLYDWTLGRNENELVSAPGNANMDNGLSSSTVKICSGTGAQKEPC